jgi:hypothetical protein
MVETYLINGPAHTVMALRPAWTTSMFISLQNQWFLYTGNSPYLYFRGNIIDLQHIPFRYPIERYEELFQILKAGKYTAEIWFTKESEYLDLRIAQGEQALMFLRTLFRS